MEKGEKLTREKIEKMSLHSLAFDHMFFLAYKIINEQVNVNEYLNNLAQLFLNLDEDLKLILIRNYLVNDLKFKEIPCIDYFVDDAEKYSQQLLNIDFKGKFKGINNFEEIKGESKEFYNQIIEIFARIYANKLIFFYYQRNPEKFGNIYDTYNELKEKFNMDDYSAFGDLKDVGIEAFKTHFKNDASKDLVGMIGDIAGIAKAIYEFFTSKDKWTEEKLFSLLKSFLDVAVSWGSDLLNKTFLTPGIKCLYDLTFDVLIPVIKKILAKEEFQTEEIVMIVGQISIKVGYTVGIAAFPGLGIVLSIGKLALDIIIDKTMREKIVGVFKEGAKLMFKGAKLYGKMMIGCVFANDLKQFLDKDEAKYIDILQQASELSNALTGGCIII